MLFLVLGFGQTYATLVRYCTFVVFIVQLPKQTSGTDVVIGLEFGYLRRC
jgi:hypothetical protein